MTINCPICKRKTFDYVSFHEAIGTVEQHGHCDSCGYVVEQCYSDTVDCFFDIKKVAKLKRMEEK